MTIQHKDIPDAEIHEPKGINTAPVSTSYVSTGTGTGSWRKITPSELEGFSANLSQTNQKLVSNGSGGITSIVDNAYGVMAITNNNIGFAVSAATDATLNTDTDYVILTGTGAPWASESLFNVTFNTNRLIAPVTGIYRVDMWTDLTSFPTNVAKVAIKHVKNGVTYSTRKVQAKSNSAGDSGNLNGFGIVPLIAGEYIQLAVASSAAGNIIFNSLNMTLTLIRATA